MSMSRAKRKSQSSSVFFGRTKWALLVVIFLNFLMPPSYAWTTPIVASGSVAAPRTSSNIRESKTALFDISRSQVAVLDGAEWRSVQKCLKKQGRLSRDDKKKKSPSKMGYMTVVTGTLMDSDEDNTKSKQRVVGIQAPASFKSSKDLEVVPLSDSVSIFKDSMAYIPNNVKDEVAITTLTASLAAIHCALPTVEGVGGAKTSFVSGKVVVMGGNEYACFAAEGLAALGAKVHLVSTTKPNLKNKEIQFLTPAVGEEELGFAKAVGEFDSLVDTMGDEGQGDLDDEDPFFGRAVGTVVGELKIQHKCERYVSTLSKSQRIIRDEGVLFGPKQVDQHVADVAKAVASGQPPDSDYEYIVPPTNFSTTVQTLLDKGITYSWKQSKDVCMRGWSLKEFWEGSTWPRDSAANIRYGLPIMEEFTKLEEVDDDDEEMISDPGAYLKEKFKIEKGVTRTQLDDEAKEKAPKNSFVADIEGVEGLQIGIILPKKDCLLFMSAPYCRTCKSLTPKYNRMAREHVDDDLMFATANATGKKGKLLGKVLDVFAVPAFVLFREGKPYGTPLGVSRLPSKKLSRAIECLTSGAEWDSSILEEDKKDAK